MRQILLLALALSLVFSSVVKAKESAAQNAGKPARIQDYLLNPEKDLGWMSEKERAAYISFLYSLQVLVEAELSSDLVMAIPESLQKAPARRSRKSSKIDVILQLLEPVWSVPQSQAAGPLQLFRVLGTLVAKGTQKSARPALALARSESKAVEPAVIRQGEKFMGPAEIVPKPALPNEIGKAAAGGADSTGSTLGMNAVKAAAAATVVGVASVLPGGDDGKNKSPSASAEAAPKSEAPVVPAPKEVPPAESAPASAHAAETTHAKRTASRKFSHYRREGMFCIFGGHASAYVVSGSRTVCPAPEGTVNNPICQETGYSPSFLCQSLGLSENPKTSQISDKLCVPLRGARGLSDLTIRCADAFVHNFLPSVKAVDAQKLAEVQAQIEEGLKAVESKRGLEDVGLLEYCAKGNSLNRNLQAGPCGALLSMLEAVRKEIPALGRKSQGSTQDAKAPEAARPAAPKGAH